MASRGLNRIKITLWEGFFFLVWFFLQTKKNQGWPHGVCDGLFLHQIKSYQEVDRREFSLDKKKSQKNIFDNLLKIHNF